MNGEPNLMKMPNYVKKKLKDGMTKEFKSGNSKWVSMFYCTILVLDFFAGKLLSKWEGPYIIEEVYQSGAIKINNPEGTNPMVVNGQRIKHYILGTPINVETNIIQTMTPEEYIKETFQNTPEP
jgi:hypothetical protein